MTANPANPYAAPQHAGHQPGDGITSDIAIQVGQLRKNHVHFARCWWWGHAALLLAIILGAVALAYLFSKLGLSFGEQISQEQVKSNLSAMLVVGLMFLGMLGSLLLAIVLAIIAVIFAMIQLHMGWRLVQPGQVTPGKAVGLLCVPVFTAYWAFIAWCGLERRLSERTKSTNGTNPLFVSACVAWALAWTTGIAMLVVNLLEADQRQSSNTADVIELINLLCGLPLVVLFPLMVRRLTEDAIRFLSASNLEAA